MLQEDRLDGFRRIMSVLFTLSIVIFGLSRGLFVCLFLVSGFCNLIEIQFTYHTVHPFKVHYSVTQYVQICTTVTTFHYAEKPTCTPGGVLLLGAFGFSLQTCLWQHRRPCEGGSYPEGTSARIWSFGIL